MCRKRDCNESFRRAVDHSFDQSKLSNMSEVLQESVLTMRNDIGTPSKGLVGQPVNVLRDASLQYNHLMY